MIAAAAVGNRRVLQPDGGVPSRLEVWWCWLEDPRMRGAGIGWSGLCQVGIAACASARQEFSLGP
jgi:hypothetical protein